MWPLGRGFHIISTPTSIGEYMSVSVGACSTYRFPIFAAISGIPCPKMATWLPLRPPKLCSFVVPMGGKIPQAELGVISRTNDVTWIETQPFHGLLAFKGHPMKRLSMLNLSTNRKLATLGMPNTHGKGEDQ